MVAKLKLEISEELKNENSLWTPGSRQSVEHLWAAFESDPEQLPVDQLPDSGAGEFVQGGSKKRKKVEAAPPLSKEEALKRFKARKEAAQAEKRLKLCARPSDSLNGRLPVRLVGAPLTARRMHVQGGGRVTGPVRGATIRARVGENCGCDVGKQRCRNKQCDIVGGSCVCWSASYRG